MESQYFEFWDLLILPIYLLLTFGIAYTVAPRDDRRLFMWAMALRMGGALFFASIYLFYYKGGDTLAYYQTAKPFASLFFDRPGEAFRALFSPYSEEAYSLFNANTGYPLRYIYADPQTYTVSRLITPILFLSFNRYLAATVILSAVSFIGPWKLYVLFKDAFPDRRIAAISALFVPSVLFWGAGISKDTVTLTSAAYFVYAFYFIVVKRNFSITRLIGASVALYFLLAIKPYIFLVLLPGILLWLLSAPVSRLKNKFLRRFAVPIIALASSLIFVLVFQQLGDLLGEYGAEQIIEKALITQEDLKRDYYGGNTFDIGEVDPSFIGVLSKFPIATFYGLYGPTLLDVRNIVMLFSALENTILLALTMMIIFNFKIRRLANNMLDSPILTFCLVFSLLFAFSIGFTTPNYGAMVRFKIPLLPFFVFYLLVINQMRRSKKTQIKE